LHSYGFNGKENDNEVKGEGNQQDYGMRVYDPRVGKFLSVDPLTRTYPFYSPYLYAGNSPIRFIDVDGKGPGDGIKQFYYASKALFQVFVKNKALRDAMIQGSLRELDAQASKVVVSSFGLMNGTSNLLSLGLYNTPFEKLNLPEEYRGWYEWASLVGRSQPLPERIVGPGAGNSPSLELSGGGKIPTATAPSLKINPTPNAYVFSESKEGPESNNASANSDYQKLRILGEEQGAIGGKVDYSNGKTIGFMADKTVNGSKLEFTNTLFYPDGVSGNELKNAFGMREMLETLGAMKDYARKQGFKQLRIQWERAANSSSRNPGHGFDRTFDL
jgi:RHS repeat-associated protein